MTLVQARRCRIDSRAEFFFFFPVEQEGSVMNGGGEHWGQTAAMSAVSR
jgi:hypothetical protein